MPVSQVAASLLALATSASHGLGGTLIQEVFAAFVTSGTGSDVGSGSGAAAGAASCTEITSGIAIAAGEGIGSAASGSTAAVASASSGWPFATDQVASDIYELGIPFWVEAAACASATTGSSSTTLYADRAGVSGIFANATSRQSFLPAGVSSSSMPPPGRQPPDSSSSSSAISLSSSTSADFQSRSIRTGVTKAASSSAEVVGVSSKLPNANGCALRSMLIGAGRAGMSSTVGSSNEGTGGTGICSASGLNAAGSSLAATGSGSCPRETPARASADFTIEIKGSGGTNGFLSTPSAPTRCASCSSRGSKAPTSKITGMCERAASSFTYLQTS